MEHLDVASVELAERVCEVGRVELRVARGRADVDVAEKELG